MLVLETWHPVPHKTPLFGGCPHGSAQTMGAASCSLLLSNSQVGPICCTIASCLSQEGLPQVAWTKAMVSSRLTSHPAQHPFPLTCSLALHHGTIGAQPVVARRHFPLPGPKASEERHTRG